MENDLFRRFFMCSLQWILLLTLSFIVFSWVNLSAPIELSGSLLSPLLYLFGFLCKLHEDSQHFPLWFLLPRTNQRPPPPNLDWFWCLFCVQIVLYWQRLHFAIGKGSALMVDCDDLWNVSILVVCCSYQIKKIITIRLNRKILIEKMFDKEYNPFSFLFQFKLVVNDKITMRLRFPVGILVSNHFF